MRIGVLSDTHIPVAADKLPDKIIKEFKQCDLIVHAGDIVELFVIEELNKLAETKAVHGNMDSREVKQSLPEKIILNVAGKKIGIIHGNGPGFKVPKNAKKAFRKKLDIIIFGHSHIPYNEKLDSTLMFNPGSATDNVFGGSCSFGIIEIDGDNIQSKIIKV